MFKSISTFEKLPGKTLLLVDISGSMNSPISSRSENMRINVAAGLAMLTKEICEESRIFAFNSEVKEIPSRRGFALADKLVDSAQGATYLGKAVNMMNNLSYDRLIVFTDEQSMDEVPNPVGKGYMINVASYQRGVGYGKWVHIDGFSDGVIKYITEYEKLSSQ